MLEAPPFCRYSRMTAPRTIDSGSSRDVPLEALRGIAALVVVAWHFTMSFFRPNWMLHIARRYALHRYLHSCTAQQRLAFSLALSGYVLTRRYFETSEKRILIIGALKRWFRLFLPVFLSVMMSWILFHFSFVQI